MKVYDALKEGDLKKARFAVSMVVGRDTEVLDDIGVTKAAVETVAENASDGVIAPGYEPEALEILAQKKGCGVSEIALAWLLHQKEEVFPIVSPSTREHMKENAKAFSVKLTEDELKWMAII